MQKACDPAMAWNSIIIKWEGEENLKVQGHKTYINVKGVKLLLGLIALVKESFVHPPNSSRRVLGRGVQGTLRYTRIVH